MITVSDTSPIILLGKAGHLRLLEKLFRKIIIPPAVDTEWLRPGDYNTPKWISVEKLSPEAQHVAESLHNKIDKGEAEAIALSLALKAEWVLLDDLKARKQAQSMSLTVVGTVGILVSAKRKGMIHALRPILDALKRHRFYLSDDLLQKSLLLAGER